MNRIFLLLFFLISNVFAQWNDWTDAESVQENLLKAQEEKKIYFSQFHLFDVRNDNNIQSSVFREKTKENLYIYGLDFYYASGTYFDSTYKATKRKNIIEVVREQWRVNRAIPSFSWHLENPYVKSSFRNYMGCRYRKSVDVIGYPSKHRYVIHEILNHSGDTCGFGRYKSVDDFSMVYQNPAEWFDARTREIAAIINEFVDDSGKPIPFIFRLWHEMEDNWMWWGKNHVTPSDYKAFFALTRKKIMEYTPKAQILWAYSPDSYLDSEEKFMERYPGDEYVDIIGYDDYKIAKPQYREREILYARMVSKLAKAHGKVAAMFETSNSYRPTSDYFFKEMLLPVLNDSLVSIGLFQMWSSGLFENDAQYEDRLFFLNQDNVLKVEKNNEK